jgi:hypothetical protein
MKVFAALGAALLFLSLGTIVAFASKNMARAGFAILAAQHECTDSLPRTRAAQAHGLHQE